MKGKSVIVLIVVLLCSFIHGGFAQTETVIKRDTVIPRDTITKIVVPGETVASDSTVQAVLVSADSLKLP